MGRRKRERCETNINWLPPMCPEWGSNPQLRHVPLSGIKPTTLQFTGRCSSQLSHTGQGANTFFECGDYTSECLEISNLAIQGPLAECGNHWLSVIGLFIVAHECQFVTATSGLPAWPLSASKHEQMYRGIFDAGGERVWVVRWHGWFKEHEVWGQMDLAFSPGCTPH